MKQLHNNTGYGKIVLAIAQIFLLAAFLVAFDSCKQSGPSIPGKNERSADTFTPNPKKAEKQEVKTLATGAAAPAFNLPDISGKF
jgi:hypothetical protein